MSCVVAERVIATSKQIELLTDLGGSYLSIESNDKHNAELQRADPGTKVTE